MFSEISILNYVKTFFSIVGQDTEFRGFASCCAGSNSAQKVGDSRKKSNNQNGKKKLRWFPRSK